MIINTSKLEKIAVGASLGLIILASVLPNKIYEKTNMNYGHFAVSSAGMAVLGFGLCAYNSHRKNKQMNYEL